MQLAQRMGCAHYTDVNLGAWAFDILWGNPGDVAPLCMYERNEACAALEEDYVAGPPKRYAFVKVAANNSLVLCVGQYDESEGELRCDAPDELPLGAASDRFEQQRRLFGLRWGPAPHFR
eukprot:2492725-Rhodomonas_salina.1